MDEARAAGLAIGADALVQLKLRAARAPKSEADRKRERRAKRNGAAASKATGEGVTAPPGTALT